MRRLLLGITAIASLLADAGAQETRVDAAAFSGYVDSVRAALDAEEWDRALLLAQRAHEAWPDLCRPLLHAAAAQLGSDAWGPAISAARQARSARDDHMPPAARAAESADAADYWEGVALYETQRYDEALPLLRRAAEKRPDWAEASRALGEATFVAGDMDAAAAAYSAAFRTDGRIGTSRDLTYYAEATAEAGDLESAVAAVQEALQRDPYEPGLHANLADLLRREGDVNEAYYHFTLEILLHGTDSRFGMTSLNAATDILEKLRQAEESPERHELFLISTGLANLREGKAHTAAHSFEHAARVTRSATPVPQLLLAEAFLRSGNAEAARLQLRRVLELEPDFVPALVLLAEALRALGDEEQAQITVERAYALFPNYWKLDPSRQG
jgi:tetratricopeptide (TPR) repeat protein